MQAAAQGTWWLNHAEMQTPAFRPGLDTAGRTSLSLKCQGAPVRAAQVILLNGDGEVLLPDLRFFCMPQSHAMQCQS